MQVSTPHRTGEGKIQPLGQLSKEVFQLHYFCQGFEGLRTSFHIGLEFKENGFSLSSDHLKRGKVNFLQKVLACPGDDQCSFLMWHY